MRYALLVLEQPWSPISADPRQSSVRPFLEGLAALNNLPLYYATLDDEGEVDLAALDAFLEEMAADALPGEEVLDDEEMLDDDVVADDEASEANEISLSDGLTIALRYRRPSGRYRTEILSAERRWPVLMAADDEEGV